LEQLNTWFIFTSSVNKGLFHCKPIKVREKECLCGFHNDHKKKCLRQYDKSLRSTHNKDEKKSMRGDVKEMQSARLEKDDKRILLGRLLPVIEEGCILKGKQRCMQWFD